MAAVNQDFITFVGDTVKPIFLVQDVDGNAVDISAATEIVWTVRRNLTDTVALSKSKTANQITFPGSGTDGKFQVAITAADTNGLTGWYVHSATITDANGNVTTVVVGRMNVGQAPNFTHDDAAAATESLYLVRALIGDTDPGDQLLSDQIIAVVINRYSGVELAAAECCRMIAAKYARLVDVVNGQLKTNYSNRRKAYMLQAADLEQRGYAKGSVTAYVGGISQTDKANNAMDDDRVPPQFLIGMFDDQLPEPPIGHQAGVGQNSGSDDSGLTG